MTTVRANSAWAVKTSGGIILIDTLFGYAAQDEIVDGMKKLGLDPADIKYVIISHAHGDHDGAVKFLQDISRRSSSAPKTGNWPRGNRILIHTTSMQPTDKS